MLLRPAWSFVRERKAGGEGRKARSLRGKEIKRRGEWLVSSFSDTGDVNKRIPTKPRSLTINLTLSPNKR